MTSMKKIKLFLIVLLTMFVLPNVYADNFDKFSVTTNFSNDINVMSIKEIIVLISVPGEEDFREISLLNSNLYNYSSTDIPNTATFDSAYVVGDVTGNYNVTGKYAVNDNSANLQIMVSIYKPNTTTTTVSTTKNVTTSSVNGDDIIVIDDNGNVVNPEDVTTTEKTTTISTGAKLRMSAYKYILLIAGVFVAFIVFMIIVKVIRTSNLM